MGCGACGGGSSIKTVRDSVRNVIPKPRQIPAPILRPLPTSRIVVTSVKPSTANLSIKQIEDAKKCPLCGASLSPMLSGSGARNRKRCSHCNRIFVYG